MPGSQGKKGKYFFLYYSKVLPGTQDVFSHNCYKFLKYKMNKKGRALRCHTRRACAPAEPMNEAND